MAIRAAFALSNHYTLIRQHLTVTSSTDAYRREI